MSRVGNFVEDVCSRDPLEPLKTQIFGIDFVEGVELTICDSEQDPPAPSSEPCMGSDCSEVLEIL